MFSSFIHFLFKVIKIVWSYSLWNTFSYCLLVVFPDYYLHEHCLLCAVCYPKTFYSNQNWLAVNISKQWLHLNRGICSNNLTPDSRWGIIHKPQRCRKCICFTKQNYNKPIRGRNLTQTPVQAGVGMKDSFIIKFWKCTLYLFGNLDLYFKNV